MTSFANKSVGNVNRVCMHCMHCEFSDTQVQEITNVLLAQNRDAPDVAFTVQQPLL